MRSTLIALTIAGLASPLSADDWPQFMGPNRDSTWREKGVVKKLPAGGPEVMWRAPVANGYAGPAVAEGKVYLMDFVITGGKIINNAGSKVPLEGKERVRCFDAANGKELWTKETERKYEVSYPGGPRATVTVAGDQLFALGAMGHLMCYRTNGERLWERDFGKEFGAPIPQWGHSAAPLVHGEVVICMVGGEDGLVVAFNRKDGKVAWKALKEAHAAYCPPQVIKQAGVEQLIAWHPGGVSSLDPASGRELWTVPLKPTGGVAVAMPRQVGNQLFASGYNRVGALLDLEAEKPGAKIAWRGSPRNAVYCVNSTPYILDGTIYGVDIDASALMAVSLEDGKRLWETQKPTIAEGSRGRHGTAFIVYHPGNKQFWLFGEMGDLIIAELSPEGYMEVSRAHVMEPTNTMGSRKVLWSHPAFAMKSVFIRNDRELVRFNLSE